MKNITINQILTYSLYFIIGVIVAVGFIHFVNAELFDYKHYGYFKGSFKDNLMIIDGRLIIQDTKPFKFIGVGLLKQVDSKGLHSDCTNVNSYYASIKLDNSDILRIIVKGKLCDAGNDWKTYRGTYKIVSSKMQFTQKVLGDGLLVMIVNPDGKIIDGRINGVIRGY